MYFTEITQGFFLGGSLSIAIGAQNAFVLSQLLIPNSPTHSGGLLWVL